jgi:uncharacterized protein YecE (DUF72 family)
MAESGELRVGTSGYQYDHWRGRLYPHDAPKSHWFDIYAEHFDSVEINNTFYHLPSESTFDSWREQAPPGFRFALKYSRYGSHLKHLKDPQQHVGLFVERAERLGARLGPTLVQLPTGWKLDLARLEDFLSALPRRLRWAVEVRHASWLCDPVYAALHRHGAALCIHDLLDNHPHELTADWTYLRFHGPENRRKYAGNYPHQALSATAQRICGWLSEGHDVYAYFNNDEKGYAVENALDLRRFVQQQNLSQNCGTGL